VNIIAVDDEVADGSGSVGTVDTDTNTVGSQAWSRAPSGVLLDVMDVVVEDLDMGTASGYANSPRDASVVASPIVAHLEALDAHEVHIGQLNHAGVTFGWR
jgi:hypothetical protein